MISFIVVLMAGVAMAQDLPASVSSQINAAIASYRMTLNAQPAVSTLYSEVISDLGGTVAWNSLLSQENSIISVYGTTSTPSSVAAQFSAYETALPSSVLSVWLPYLSSVEQVESSISQSISEAFEDQATTTSTPATMLTPATTSGPTAASAVGTTETVSSGHAAATGGSAVLGVAAGVAAAAGFVAAVL